MTIHPKYGLLPPQCTPWRPVIPTASSTPATRRAGVRPIPPAITLAVITPLATHLATPAATLIRAMVIRATLLDIQLAGPAATHLMDLRGRVAIPLDILMLGTGIK
jgi:hypothetical protein